MKVIWEAEKGGYTLTIFDTEWNDGMLNVSLKEIIPTKQGGTDQITRTMILNEDEVESLKVALMSWPPYRLC